MASVKVKHRIKGYYELRSAPGVQSDLEARGRAVQKGCGEGYEMSSSQGKRKPQGRWRVAVFTRTRHAMRDNMKNNTLLRNLDKARG